MIETLLKLEEDNNPIIEGKRKAKIIYPQNLNNSPLKQKQCLEVISTEEYEDEVNEGAITINITKSKRAHSLLHHVIRKNG